MVSSECYGTSQGRRYKETKNKCDRMEKIKRKKEKKENMEERNLEVEKEMEDKRKRNRFIDMSLKVNRRIRNQQHENTLQAQIELLTKIT